jgi:hypothetical protein
VLILLWWQMFEESARERFLSICGRDRGTDIGRNSIDECAQIIEVNFFNNFSLLFGGSTRGIHMVGERSTKHSGNLFGGGDVTFFVVVYNRLLDKKVCTQQNE